MFAVLVLDISTRDGSIPPRTAPRNLSLRGAHAEAYLPAHAASYPLDLTGRHVSRLFAAQPHLLQPRNAAAAARLLAGALRLSSRQEQLTTTAPTEG